MSMANVMRRWKDKSKNHVVNFILIYLCIAPPFRMGMTWHGKRIRGRLIPKCKGCSWQLPSNGASPPTNPNWSNMRSTSGTAQRNRQKVTSCMGGSCDIPRRSRVFSYQPPPLHMINRRASIWRCNPRHPRHPKEAATPTTNIATPVSSRQWWTRRTFWLMCVISLWQPWDGPQHSHHLLCISWQ